MSKLIKMVIILIIIIIGVYVIKNNTYAKYNIDKGILLLIKSVINSGTLIVVITLEDKPKFKNGIKKITKNKIKIFRGLNILKDF